MKMLNKVDEEYNEYSYVSDSDVNDKDLDGPHDYEHEDVPNANFHTNNHEHNHINAHIHRQSYNLGVKRLKIFILT